MPDIVAPDSREPIVNNEGLMQDHFQVFIENVARLDLIIGTGSPEGVVVAAVGREYMDRNGTTGAIKYIKRDDNIGGDKSQGWILV